jgi:hypothetical protein
MKRDDLPLQVGEMVKYNDYRSGAGVAGIIVERLGDDYIRVKWGDLSVPTTHRSHSLRRADARILQR